MTKRFAVVSILVALLVFGILAINEDWSLWEAKEADYDALQNIAYDIVENKDISQPLSETLKRYDVSVNADGTIDIALYSHSMATLKIALNADYQIQELQKGSMLSAFVFAVILVFGIIGIAITGIGYLIYWAFKKIYTLIKTQIKK